MIRKFNSRHLAVDDFIGARNMDRKIADQLKRAVENQHRIPIGGRILYQIAEWPEGTCFGGRILLERTGK